MKAVEIDGKTIDEAIEKACSDFGVSRDKLHIEIISEGTSGFLGLLGSKKAKIKASLMSLDMTIDTPPGSSKTSAKGRKHEESVASASLDQAADKSGEPVALRARTILEGILTGMGINTPVSVEETEDSILLNIQGDGGGLLIGRRGQNLDAIQYIVNKAANRSANGRKMIIIDTEAYRKRREESLISLAEKLGEKVKKTKKAITVSHMNAHDRRIIHMALQNDESLTTKSRGEGEYRKILIIPSKRN
jgi:spoIIIJ-associated protein